MKYTFIFIILGASVSYLGITLGHWWNVAHWFSFTCIALAFGYAGLGPIIFGKRRNGRIPVWSRIIHLPYMVYSEIVWNIARLLSRENAHDIVSDDLVLGRRLRSTELVEGLVNYVDLTAETEDPKRIRKLNGYICFPILDGSVPVVPDLVNLIASLPSGRTYVHCAQGHGRTGLFAIALLAKKGLVGSYEDGLAMIQQARPGIGLNRRQEAFVKKYIAEQRLVADSA